MKILLFGGSGQLGQEVRKRAGDLNFEIVSPIISEVDISDKDQVLYLADQIQPDLIINSAAYTLVDKAEEEEEEAYRNNADGAENVAVAAKETGAGMILLSTDYVFDGELGRPLKETDQVNPLSVYGASKLEGERRVASVLGGQAVIVRTSSLHGAYGQNFVHTMLKLFEEHEELKVVNDQLMSPTWAGWLAEVLLDLARLDAWPEEKGGLTLHASCAGAISWFDFANEILRLSLPSLTANLGTQPAVVIQPVPATEFPRPAVRPAYSVFDCSKLSGILGVKPLDWQRGLRNHLRDIDMILTEE